VYSNTAQLLVTLTETNSPSADRQRSVKLLEEAIELLQRCLTLQELQLTEAETAQEEAEGVDEDTGGVPLTDQMDVSMSDADAKEEDEDDEDEKWAAIVEPVTYSTLLDTTIAQIEALSSMCTVLVYGSTKGLAWVEEYTGGLLNKAALYAEKATRTEDLLFPRAMFTAALADSAVREGKLSIVEYQVELKNALANIDKNEHLPSKAEALITFASTAADSNSGLLEPLYLKKMQWDALTEAVDCLKKAATTSQEGDFQLNINTILAETELLRLRLAEEPDAFPAAVKSRLTLAKNAGVYYNGAEKWATAIGHGKASLQIRQKLAVLRLLGYLPSQDLSQQSELSMDGLTESLGEMIEDGMLPEQARAQFALKVGELSGSGASAS
jgi:hypothetical protein